MDPEVKRVLTTESRDRLPDSAFADRENRRYPHHFADGGIDRSHLANALSRCAQSQTECSPAIRAHLEAHARDIGMGDRGKDFTTAAADLHTFVPMAEIKSAIPHDFKLSETGDVVVAFAQTDAVDGDQDYTYAGAFPTKNAIISDFGHSSWPERGGRLPTGKGETKEHGGWAVLNGHFFMETDQGRNAYHTVKAMGEDQRWSYGYDVLEKASPPPGVKAKRGLKLLDVHEVSPVLLAAQISTHTMGLKGATLDQDLEDLAIDGIVDYMTAIKEGSLAGLPFAEASTRMLRDIEAFTSRAAAIQEMRLKEGRAISSKRLALLNEHHTALLSAADMLKSMIDAVTPASREPERDAVAAEEAAGRAGKARAARAAAELAAAMSASAHRLNTA